MSGRQIIGVILLAVGLLALAYGGFTFTKDSHEVDVGPIEFSIEEKERVNVPLWAGVASAIAGVVLLTSSRRR